MPSRDIVIHIGFPKTATTALQHGLFRHDPAVAYLGKLNLHRGLEAARLGAPRSRYAEEVGNELVRELLWSSAQRWSGGDPGVVTRLLEAAEEAGLTREGPLVLSDEDMLEAVFGGCRTLARRDDNRMVGVDPDALAARIAAFAYQAWPGRVKILLTLRRQDSLLASLFAQTFDKRIGTPVDTLERFATAVMGDQYYSLGGLALDYEWLIGRLEQAVGPGNVEVAVYEDLRAQPERIVSQLQRLVNADPDLARSALSNVSFNVRTRGQGGWRTRRYRGRNYLRHTGQWLQRTLNRAPDPKWITLTEDLSGRILARYEDSNRRLAQRLGQSLACYGYHSE
jgi:hypothetical protein